MVYGLSSQWYFCDFRQQLKVYYVTGLPAGIISFLPADGPVFGNAITSSPYLSAINFTGSVPTFKYLWKKVAENLDTYISFPRLIGGLFAYFNREFNQLKIKISSDIIEPRSDLALFSSFVLVHLHTEQTRHSLPAKAYED